MISLLAFSLLVAVNLGFHARSTRRAWKRRRTKPQVPAAFPPLSILKPTEGPVPGFAQNLETFARQDYPAPLEIIGCVPSAADPAAAAFCAISPGAPEGVTVRLAESDDAPPALNRKVRHLEAGLRAATHGVLVFSDDDVRLAPGQLAELYACLASGPDVGAAFCAPSIEGAGAGTRWIHHWLCAAPTSLYLLANISPGGPAPNGGCLMLTRATLERLGGLAPLRDHIGDDLGLAVAMRKAGLRAVLAPTPAVSEMGGLSRMDAWRMMHRWMVVVSAYFPAFLPTYPAVLCSLPLLGLWTAAAIWSGGSTLVYLGGVGLVWAARIATGWVLARRIFGQRYPASYALLQPFAEAVYLAAWTWALVDRRITWRGRRFRVGRNGTMRALNVR